METYQELKSRQEKERNALPIFWAFSNAQFKEGMEKVGLTIDDTNKIYKLGGGGFYKKIDSKIILGTFDRHEIELQNAVEADKTGEGFIFEMFDYELGNHEYCYTQDMTDTINALGYTEDQIMASPTLSHGLAKAAEAQREWAYSNNI